MNKSQIEKRLQKLEEQTQDDAPVMVFDSKAEAEAYTGRASVIIIDDIPRSKDI